MDFTPVDLGDLDLSGMSRDDILAALIDAAIIGAPDEAEFSAAAKSTGELAPPEIPGAGELPAHENAPGKLAPPENTPSPGLSKSTVPDAQFYDPEEARDDKGQWTGGGGVGTPFGPG